jgi:hypothetical protein
MMSEPPAVESESDPTYTHFTHRDEFSALLNEFLRRTKLDEEHVDGEEDAREVRLVNQMGGIVRIHSTWFPARHAAPPLRPRNE